MKAFMIVVSMLVTWPVMAQGPCQFEDTALNVGESIWVLDPALVAAYRKEQSAKGRNADEIERGIRHHDWLGYRLKCVSTYVPGKSEGGPSEIIQTGGVALVLNEYSDDYYESVQKSLLSGERQ
ncbi:hypothetical protein [Alteromonas sp.]|uniref:hypothetical protein n=1 Tax=Alteromonas sp. TaxID=232 RepID=UPI000C3A0CC0|nr:hypothetical protein [Alteromonas sp.]MAI36464.1 hypothetical protein [Alteromonas sp.]